MNDSKLRRRVTAVPLHAKQALSGGRGIALPILDLGVRRGWVVSTMPRLVYSMERDPVAGWAMGPVWTGPEDLASTWVRTPDRPARSESLYL